MLIAVGWELLETAASTVAMQLPAVHQQDGATRDIFSFGVGSNGDGEHKLTVNTYTVMTDLARQAGCRLGMCMQLAL